LYIETTSLPAFLYKKQIRVAVRVAVRVAKNNKKQAQKIVKLHKIHSINTKNGFISIMKRHLFYIIIIYKKLNFNVLI